MLLAGIPMLLINSQVEITFRELLVPLLLVHHVFLIFWLQQVDTMMLGSLSSEVPHLHQPFFGCFTDNHGWKRRISFGDVPRKF